MATVAETFAGETPAPSAGRSFARVVDRWIFVFMAGLFIAIVLAGFIPSSLAKIEAVRSGARPPFPMVLHLHAVLMGSFLMLLLAQTWLAAIGRCDLHRRLGLAAIVLVPALVAVGLILAPTIYHAAWAAAQSAPPEAAERMQRGIAFRDNILLLQIRVGILFPLFIAIGLRARRGNAGLHKRMMILAAATPLGAGIDRIMWLPSTMPASPLSSDLYTLLALSPLLVWDLARNRSLHRAWLIWFAIYLPFAVLLNGVWDTAWWHSVVPGIMGVGA